jgi:hypothetical protein
MAKLEEIPNDDQLGEHARRIALKALKKLEAAIDEAIISPEKVDSLGNAVSACAQIMPDFDLEKPDEDVDANDLGE